MKTAVNSPVSDMSLNVGAMKYGLAHIALDNRLYREFLGSPKRYTILDNAADELGTGLTGDDLWGLVRAIRPDEIILPDILKDGEGTYEASMKFYNDHLALQEDKPKAMAVAQGKTLEEWMSSYKTWLELDLVDVIGVPYDVDFEVGAQLEGEVTKTNFRAHNRINLIRKIVMELPIRKPIHLLGMNNLRELEVLRDSVENHNGFIRSNDTTGPFAAALDGKDWSTLSYIEKDFEKDWPALDFDHEWEKEEKIRAYKNLFAYGESAGDHSIAYNIGRVYSSDKLLGGGEEIV